MQVFKIDENGYYIGPIIIRKDEEVPEGCIEVQPPNGLYRAKWVNDEWVEDMTQEEIEAENNKPKEPTQDELIMLAIADLDAQRENDKLESQLAIAELAETMLGGTV